MNCKQLAKDQEITDADIFDFSADMIQRLLYKCQFCNFYSVKDLWGVGRNTCPTCKERQISPDDMCRECEVCGCGYKYEAHCIITFNNYKDTDLHPLHKFKPGQYIYSLNPYMDHTKF